MLRLLRHAEFRRGLRSGVAAATEHANVPFENDFATVIDVGASRGQFALFAVTRFPNARVISFEPLAEPRKKLQDLMGSRVEVVPCAVGDLPGTTGMSVSGRDDSSSVLPIGTAQERFFPGTEEVGRAKVPQTTLDLEIGAELRRPCLLKVDVQGFELEVLKGAPETLKLVDEALIECSFMELYEGQALADEVISFVLESGLRLVGVHGQIRTASGQSIQADLHFRRNGQ